MKRFENKVVLITGAASGIGRAAAERVASEGGRVFCVDVNADPLAGVVARVGELGGEGAAHGCDVSQAEACRATVAACVERFGRLDALVNMAGIIRMGHTESFSIETWQQVLNINLSGTFYMCQAAIPHLLEVKGNIVNAASSICFRATPYAAAYAASKGGILTMSRMLAVEFGKQGLRVNSVAPGQIDTPMAAPPGFPEDADFKIIQRSMALTGGEAPSVVAAAIAYLASEDAHHVNGEHILVDGATCA
ncbi:MAG: SDR family NAD(P)-dependent oxidoreductase [Candidatus Binatia bacterium]|nr:SDR family NAD(P)-dependent oxidoreductase [Candidatus Binatia bacterium]